MRQVPGSNMFLIIGDGRLARHLSHYLKFESLPFESWRRSQGREELAELAARATHILLAITDSSIAKFHEENADLFKEKTVVHFSGALIHPLIPSAHPLMSFSNDLYEPSTYRRIAFITEKGRGGFASLLPGLKNAAHELQPELKPLYHALCVMSGNFTVLLWEKAFRDFEAMGLPRFALLPYLERTAVNLLGATNGASVLTGPLARGDQPTIEKNIAALEGDAFQKIYLAFREAVAQQTEIRGAQASDGDIL